MTPPPPRTQPRLVPALAGDALLSAFFVVEARLRHDDEARTLRAEPADHGSTRHLGVAVTVAAVAAPLLALVPYGRLRPRWGWSGVALMAAGLALRTWSARTLGASYTRTLRTPVENTVVTSGPYAHVRHPGYAGALCLWVGYGLSLTSTPALVAAAAPTTVAYLRRIRVEERLLNARLGDSYATYRRRTARLVPRVY